MLAGVGVRQPGTMPTSGRTSQFGDFGPFQSKNNNDEIPALGQSFASSSKPWGPSIWGSNPIGSGFASTARDATSRGRAENGQYPSTTTDGEAKKGSASLVASSESDTWGRQRSPWGTADANATAKAPLSIPRSSGVSPSRPLNNGQAQAQQPYIEPSQAASSYFAAPRAGSISHTSSNSMARPRLDPTSGSFSIGRPQDGMSNGFPTFGRFSEVDAQAAQQAVQRVTEQSANNWVTDASSVHSPTDDRRSVTNSDYFVSSSAGPSRSGSLPPSRHGTDPPHMPQAADAFARFSQMPPHSRAHNASFSGPATGRAFAERSGSIQSESLGMFSRLTLDNDTDHSVGGFKQSGNVNGAVTFDSPQAYEQPTDVQQSMVRHEDGPLNGGVPFPSDVLSNGIYNEALLQARGLQYNRMQQITPAGSSFRQSPYNSHTATPPAFDHLYPSRSEQHTRTQSTQSAVNPLTLDRKLQNIQSFQLSQEQQRLMAQYPQMVAAAAGQFRNPYQYYAMPGLMNMSPMHPGLQLPTIPAPFAAPYVEVPSGPRDQMPTDMRSKCLDDFKANNKTNKKYELKDIYDHIAEFSGDQHGSRFIQSKLETANSEEKERVFREIYPESLPLMQDVFGNYVIQKFFEHGDQSQKKALAGKMKGNMLSLSLQMYGCRVVQKALEHILSDQQASLVKELESHVLKCVKDQNGNHVIQKAIERVPPEHIQFIFKAFTGQVGTLATHAYGCRVIQRMLEHCEPATRNSILQELHLCGASLITDSYGNYVTQHIIEHGGPEDRAKVIHLIRDQLISYSKHKFASNVVEKCLVFGTEEQRHDIMMKIVEKNERGESSLLGLIKDGYGNYVIQKLLDTLGPADYAIFVENLQPEMLKAKRLISGKHVQAVEKKMHRFDRYDVLPDNPCRSSISTTGTSTDRSAAATPPPLTNDTQSPKSASVPSASNSTAGEPAPTSTTPAKAAATTTTLQDGGVALGINEAA